MDITIIYQQYFYYLKICHEPCLLWLNWLGIISYTKMLLVRFPIRSHAKIMGSILSMGDMQAATDLYFAFTSVSLSPFLFFKEKKINKNVLLKSHEYMFCIQAVFLKNRFLFLWHRNSSSFHPAEQAALRSVSTELMANLFVNAAQWEELVLDMGQVKIKPAHIWLFSLKTFPSNLFFPL